MENNLTLEEIEFIAKLITESNYSGSLEQIEYITGLARSILTKLLTNVQQSDTQ